MAEGGNGRQKIAILGGGVGAMAAAFALTEPPGWQERYEVTVYQLGWRLGGKGASGRNRALGERIEEHGLHIWLGFYENAFGLMRRCYQELGRPAGAPLGSWEDAFKKHRLITLMEQKDGDWLPWVLDFPPNDEVPGDGGVLLRPWDYVRLLLRWLVDLHDRSPHGRARAARGLGLLAGALVGWVEQVCCDAARAGRVVEQAAAAAVQWRPAGPTHLHEARALAESLPEDPHAHQARHHQALVWLLEQFLHDFHRDAAGQDDDFRRLSIWLQLGVAGVKGMLLDGVVFHGFDVIDRYDLTEWLRRHGAADPAVWWSAPVRGIYELVFGYDRGDTRRPDLGAGTGLRGTLRMFFTYKGAIFWKMQAGMGDTIFAPLYEVLRRRGVRFEFFHRVDRLGCSADGRCVETIDLGVQATVKEEVVRGAGGYQPLRPVKGLPCWPSEPLYEQLAEGEELRRRGVDLESAWATWPDVARRTLRRGQDFDVVVLGIPVGALAPLCADLMAANAGFRDMVANVKTVQTLAFQLWLTRDAEELGWVASEPALLSSYVEPFDTWADMSHLIAREDWPADAGVRSIAYFCGPMEDADDIPAPFTDPGFPAGQDARVKKQALYFLQTSVRPLWPRAVTPGAPEGINWELLADPQGRPGEQHFDAQYWRANVDPAERYVLSVKGSVGYRLRPDRSGFANLYLAGDWTYNGLNAGCVEAAAMSGLMASRALCGHPREIVGESDL